MQVNKSDTLVSDARALRDVLSALRRRMEEVVNQAKGGSSDISIVTDALNDQLQGTYEAKSPLRGSIVKSEDGQNSKKGTRAGLSAVREASVVVFGGLNDGRGLSAADTLVRCGVRRLVLFDVEDAAQAVDVVRQRWDLEENPNLEIEAYVSEYTLDENTFDHLLDRLMNAGGNGDIPVDLVVLAPVESDEVYDLVHRGAREAGVRLLKLGEGMVATLVEPSGSEITMNIEGLTLGSAAIEVLLQAS